MSLAQVQQQPGPLERWKGIWQIARRTLRIKALSNAFIGVCDRSL